MAVSENDGETIEESVIPVQLVRFSINGLFGYLNHTVNFPQISPDASQPEIMIVEGENGTGKTTIMKMIAGIIDGLDFDPFRAVPFNSAQLFLSTGQYIGVYRNEENADFPLTVTFDDISVTLVRDKERMNYSPAHSELINLFRGKALPLLKRIDFELLTIDRSLEIETKSAEVYVDPRTGEVRNRRRTRSLSNRVRDFLRDAQVNYRQFFQAAELELLPRILKRFESLEATLTVDDLKNRISVVRDRNGEINRFGLQSDETELETLSNLLDNPLYHNEQHALTLISSYIEIHENRSEARGLIARRLSLFEQIMDDFLVGKVVRIKSRSGLEILGSTGKLDERELSSGEFHFLFMMVAALLCQRTGTILAIDEPELSLHVKWQRKLVSALSKCSSGASPIFFLATHSTSISAAHAHSVQTLSAID